jgi:Na+-driven multidrug efflux pump
MKSIAWNHCLLIALFFWIVSAVMIVGSDQCAKHITPSAQLVQSSEMYVPNAVIQPPPLLEATWMRRRRNAGN